MQRIMVLDDSADDRFFASRALKKLLPEMELHEFSYAEDALGFLRSPGRQGLDMLFVDINMPRMDGFEFADAYLELYPELRGNAPVFITSSSLNPADKVRAKAHPAIAGFVEKPITRKAIEALLADPAPSDHSSAEKQP